MCLSLVNTEQCNPTYCSNAKVTKSIKGSSNTIYSFEIPSQTPECYCSERKPSDTTNYPGCTTGWSMFAWGCKGYLDGRSGLQDCECTSNNGCNSGSTCKCVAEFDSNHNYCYKKRNECTNCEAGKYLLGCGCALNKNNMYECSAGTCEVCPKGHRCPGGKSLPIQCLNEYEFQNETGKSTCTRCVLNNEYPIQIATGGCCKGNLNQSECLSDDAFKTSTCSHCQPTASASQCPDRVFETIFYAKMKKCEPCQNTECTHPKYLKFPEGHVHYCYHSEITPEIMCIEQYHNTTKTPESGVIYSTSAPNKANNWQYNKDYGTIVIGSMPWRAGYQRTIPTFFALPIPGPTGKEHIGFVPYYQKCPGLDPKPQHLQYTKNETIITYLNGQTHKEKKWMYDCDVKIITDCLGSHQNESSNEYEQPLSRWKFCIECIQGLQFNPLTSKCECFDVNKIARTTLKDMDSRKEFFIANQDTCLDCANSDNEPSILWKKTKNSFAFEHLQCNSYQFNTSFQINSTAEVDNVTFTCTPTNSTIPYKNDLDFQSLYNHFHDDKILIGYIDKILQGSTLTIPPSCYLQKNNVHYTFNEKKFSKIIFSKPQNFKQFLWKPWDSWGVWVNCSEHEFPNDERSACLPCHKNRQKIKQNFNNDEKNRLYCASCDINKQYSNDNTSECLDRILSCSENQKLIIVNNEFKNNYCEPCEANCPPGYYKVMSSTNSNNTCSSEGISYFQCLSSTGYITPVVSNKRQKFDLIARTVLQEDCDWRLLPDHSYFVKYTPTSKKYGFQCYFSCLHGVNYEAYLKVRRVEENAIKIMFGEEAISEYQVQSNIQITQTSIQYFKSYELKTQTCTSSDECLNAQRISWSYWKKTEKRGKNIKNLEQSVLYLNTFLFIDDVLNNKTTYFNESSTDLDHYNRLCKSPGDAYSLISINNEFRYDESRIASKDTMHALYTTYNNIPSWLIKCSYDARHNIIVHQETSDTTPKYYVLNKDHNNKSCQLRNGDTIDRLEFFNYIQIETDDVYREKIQTYEDNGIQLLDYPKEYSHKHISFYNTLVDYMKYFKWRGEQKPYLWSTSSKFECSENNFKFSWTITENSNFKLEVCIPKSSFTIIMTQYCDVFEPKTTFKPGVENENITYIDYTNSKLKYCSSCSGKTGSQLIDNNDIDLRGQWLSSKGGDQRWKNTECKYECETGYYSNTDFNEYDQYPCKRCPTPLTSCDVIKGAYYIENPNCSYQGEIYPWRFKVPSFDEHIVCKSCETQYLLNNLYQHLWGKLEFKTMDSGSIYKLDDCVARCKVSEKFLTRTTKNENGTQYNVLNQSFVKLSEIRACDKCDWYPENVCNDSCQTNFLKTRSGGCQQCNYSQCSNFTYYQPQCEGQFDKPSCIPCPMLYLRNNDLLSSYSVMRNLYPNSNNTDLLEKIARWISSNQSITTRKYVNYNDTHFNMKIPAFYLPIAPILNFTNTNISHQCIIVCETNYVWYDLETFQNPFINNEFLQKYDHNRYVCLPCKSRNTPIQNTTLEGLSTLTVSVSRTTYYFADYFTSVWNQRNNVNFSFLISKTNTNLYRSSIEFNLYGSCYLCENPLTQSSYDNVFCTYNKGASPTSLLTGTLYLDSTVNVPKINTTLSLTSISKVTGSRRLLQVEDNKINIVDDVAEYINDNFAKIGRIIKVYRHPSMKQTSDFFICCESYFQAPKDIADCKAGRIKQLQRKVSAEAEGKNYGSDYCANVFTSSGNSRSLLQEVTDDNNYTQINTEKPLEYYFEEEDPTLCPAGTYKDKFGDSECKACPTGSSTRYPFTGMTSKSDCVCLPGYKTTYTTSSDFVCEQCGYNKYKNYDLSLFHNDSYCLPCPLNMETLSTTSAMCYCKPGFYWNEYNQMCQDCPMNYFCKDNYMIPCPLFSTSKNNSKDRKDCTCQNETHYGNLNEEGSYCILKNPGAICELKTCLCKAGWELREDPQNSLNVRCWIPCKAGEYVIQDPLLGNISKCFQCEQGKYSSNPQAISKESCIACPKGMTTTVEGASNITDCFCSVGKTVQNNMSIPSDCTQCKENFYLDIDSNLCKPCPDKILSLPGAIGLKSCNLCSPGQQLSTTFMGNQCTPCPIGMYSSRKSSSCSFCPKGYTTSSEGSTSRINCYEK